MLTLLHLPPELLTRIFEHFDLTQMATLRLVSQATQQFLDEDHQFWSRYLSQKELEAAKTQHVSYLRFFNQRSEKLNAIITSNNSRTKQASSLIKEAKANVMIARWIVSHSQMRKVLLDQELPNLFSDPQGTYTIHDLGCWHESIACFFIENDAFRDRFFTCKFFGKASLQEFAHCHKQAALTVLKTHDLLFKLMNRPDDTDWVVGMIREPDVCVTFFKNTLYKSKFLDLVKEYDDLQGGPSARNFLKGELLDIGKSLQVLTDEESKALYQATSIDEIIDRLTEGLETKALDGNCTKFSKKR